MSILSAYSCGVWELWCRRPGLVGGLVLWIAGAWCDYLPKCGRVEHMGSCLAPYGGAKNIFI